MTLTVDKVRETIERYQRLPRHEQIRLMNETRTRWVLQHLGLADLPANRKLVEETAAGLAAARTPAKMAVDK